LGKFSHFFSDTKRISNPHADVHRSHNVHLYITSANVIESGLPKVSGLMNKTEGLNSSLYVKNESTILLFFSLHTLHNSKAASRHRRSFSVLSSSQLSLHCRPSIEWYHQESQKLADN